MKIFLDTNILVEMAIGSDITYLSRLYSEIAKLKPNTLQYISVI